VPTEPQPCVPLSKSPRWLVLAYSHEDKRQHKARNHPEENFSGYLCSMKYTPAPNTTQIWLSIRAIEGPSPMIPSGVTKNLPATVIQTTASLSGTSFCWFLRWSTSDRHPRCQMVMHHKLNIVERRNRGTNYYVVHHRYLSGLRLTYISPMHPWGTAAERLPSYFLDLCLAA
jgi:hypothetical protein